MINLDVLRLGNLVLRRKDDKWVPVSVNVTYMSLMNEFPQDYQHIPLTKEWLERFLSVEFLKSYISGPLTSKFTYLVHGKIITVESGQVMDYESQIKLLTVDQFQNFIFFNTQKEVVSIKDQQKIFYD